MTPRDLLAEAVINCKPLAARYLAGFDDSNHTSQGAGLPNHVAWSLGHCALTMHRVAAMADDGPLPTADFAGAAPGGRATAFDPEAVAFGSKPVGRAGAYPSLSRCLEVYSAACERLAAAVRSATDEKFTGTIKWGPAEAPWWTLVVRMIFHNGFHTGQIADLRRGLGLSPIMTSAPAPR